MRAKQFLSEAPINPGEKKSFSFKIKQFDGLRRKINDYEHSLMTSSSMVVPETVKQQLEDMKKGIETEVAKLRQELTSEEEKNTVNGIPKPLHKYFQGLEKNCSKIMQAYRKLNRRGGDKFLFRGTSSDQDAIYGKPFEQRKPKDSNVDLDKYLNALMAELGIKARRDNSIFVTGDYFQASNYANPGTYIIFPRDGFDFTWSPKERDLVLNNSKAVEFFDPEKVKKIKNAIEAQWEEAKKYFGHYFSKQAFENEFFTGFEVKTDIRSIQTLINQGILSKEFEPYTEIINLISKEKMSEYFSYKVDDLIGAIRSKHEIYVNGEYYGLKHSHKEHLTKYLNNMASNSNELNDNGMLDIDDFIPGGEEQYEVTGGEHAGEVGTVRYVFYTDETVEMVTVYDQTIIVSYDHLKPHPNKITIEPVQVQLNDIVEVVKGTHKGKKGKVVYTSNHSNDIDVEFSKHDIGYVSKKAIKKVADAGNTTTSKTNDSDKIKVGDFVKLNDKVVGTAKGLTGKIVSEVDGIYSIELENGVTAKLIDKFFDVIESSKETLDLEDKSIVETIKKLSIIAGNRGWITYYGLGTLVPNSISSSDIEKILGYLESKGIDVVDEAPADGNFYRAILVDTENKKGYVVNSIDEVAALKVFLKNKESVHQKYIIENDFELILKAAKWLQNPLKPFPQPELKGVFYSVIKTSEYAYIDLLLLGKDPSEQPKV